MSGYTPTIPDDGPELRTYAPSFEVRDVDSGTGKPTRISGRAVPYNTPTDLGFFMEEFAPGAFAKSIRESAKSLPLSLFHRDHELEQLVGTNDEWIERRDGLHGVWRFDRSETAREAARMAEEGILNFLSIRFIPDPGRTKDLTKRDSRGILEDGAKYHFRREAARLVATSLVSTPAYKDSTVSWVRSAEQLRGAAGREELRQWGEFLDKVKSGPLT
jgi:Escherichia/Staphylococcus phage prohead protease